MGREIQADYVDLEKLLSSNGVEPIMTLRIMIFLWKMVCVCVCVCSKHYHLEDDGKNE